MSEISRCLENCCEFAGRIRIEEAVDRQGILLRQISSGTVFACIRRRLWGQTTRAQGIQRLVHHPRLRPIVLRASMVSVVYNVGAEQLEGTAPASPKMALGEVDAGEETGIGQIVAQNPPIPLPDRRALIRRLAPARSSEPRIEVANRPTPSRRIELTVLVTTLVAAGARLATRVVVTDGFPELTPAMRE